MAYPTVVSSAAKYVSTGTSTVTSSEKSASEPSRGDPSSDKRRISKINGMESFRNSLKIEGISGRAAELISQARRPSSISNYQSSFNRWACWCSERKVDPLKAPLTEILDFLASLFQSGLQYRTINCYRSAISAYHAYIDNQPVGEHPKICALLTGVFNQRPPQSRYTFVWDVEVVVDYIRKEMSDNYTISVSDLASKTAVLLALTAAQRVSAVRHLDMECMAKK